MGDNGVLRTSAVGSRLTQSSEKATPPQTQTGEQLTPQRLVLDNGIVVLVTPHPTADIISARIFLKAGQNKETSKNWGLSHLVASVSSKGTDRYSTQEIVQIVESAGANLGIDSSADYFAIGIKTVSEDFEDILALAANILRSPTFPEGELETERKVTLQAIKARAEQPLSSALRPMRAAIHGEHPYSQTSYGTYDTIKTLQRNDLQAFHNANFNPSEMVISIAGNITPKRAHQIIARSFEDWQTSPDSHHITLNKPIQTRKNLQVLKNVQQTQQTLIALGYPAVSVHHPDYLGLKFLMTYLCNGMSSRLFSELREKQGLAYEISGFYPTRQDNTHFVTYLGTTPEKAERAFIQMKQELERLADGALTEEELAIAKRKWAGQYALGKQTNRQIAQIFGWYEILGLGSDYDHTFLERMQTYPLEEVHRIAQTYLINPICSFVGPSDSLTFTESLV